MDFKETYQDTCSSVGIAARNGDLGLVQQLVWHGRPVDVRDNRGWTPIHEAAANGHTGCLDFLLRLDVDVEWKTFEEETSLLLAARGGHFECCRALIGYSANVNTTTKENFAPLWEAVNVDSMECVKLLLRNGAHINHQIYTGYTALHTAAEKGHATILAYLVGHGARLDICADEELTPVFLASQFGHKDCLRILLKVAKDKGVLEVVNRTASDNASPLLIAAQGGHDDCIRLLLDYGADANVPVKDLNAIAAHFAIYQNKPRCLQMLLPVTNLEFLFHNAVQFMHPLYLSLQLEDTTCLEILIAAGLNVKALIPFTEEPFEHENVRHLLFSVLGYKHCAGILSHVRYKWPMVGVDLLLRAGLSPNPQDQSELPPLVASLCRTAYSLYLTLLKFQACLNVYHERCVGNLTVLLAIQNDLANHVFVKGNTQRKIYGKYLIPLLVLGADTESCFETIADHYDDSDNTKFTLTEIVRQSNGTNLFPIFVLLMFFTCQIPKMNKFCERYFSREENEYLLKLQDSSHTLQHSCRKRIILYFAQQGRLNKQLIDSLPLPKILQDYILFSDDSIHYSDLVLDAFNYLFDQ